MQNQANLVNLKFNFMLILFPIIIAVAAIIFSLILGWRIKKQPVESVRAKEISDIIHNGAIAFLNKEYKILIIFIIIIALLLFVFL